ncbi:hypothetical protein F4779DRAFT_615013 [Xylariaceae sp. FL0662B]|nr:hypothetical protein F4779DRAFT_615013 [Xylariaceae sp. FL0662B]
MTVLGVGTVELPVKQQLGNGTEHNSILRLQDVLHIPQLKCNIIGQPLFVDHAVRVACLSDKKGEIISEQTRKQVAYFDVDSPMFQIKLSGGLHLIHCFWADSERERWINYRAKLPPEPEAGGGNKYTAEERKWLKDHYGNEFKFLLQYGLSIYKDEDRDEGRAIVRALMQEDKET